MKTSKSKNWLFQREKSKKSSNTPSGSVESQERSALIGVKAEEQPQPEPREQEFRTEPGAPATSSAIDPCRTLLASLGRFHRYVSMGGAGSPQQDWSDEAMQQLIDALEVTLGQDWEDVAQVLTETGRVLQTYENAGRADECVPFLNQSYELLCLMAVDLRHGAVRPGVIRKWEGLYETALHDIGQAGLTLVPDNPDGRRSLGLGQRRVDGPYQAAEGNTDIAPATAGNAMDQEMPFDLPEDEAPVPVPDEEIPTLEALGPLEDEMPGTLGSRDVNAGLDTGPASSERDDAGAGKDDESGEDDLLRYAFEEHAQRAVTDRGEESPDLSGLSGNSEGAQEPSAASSDSARDEEAAPPSAHVDVARVLDNLCDRLALLSENLEEPPPACFDSIQGLLKALDNCATETGADKATELCAIMHEVTALVAARAGAVEDRYVDLAYAFCGCFADAMDDPTSVVVNNWLAESSQLAEEWRGDAPGSREREPGQAAAAAALLDRLAPSSEPVEESATEILEPAEPDDTPEEATGMEDEPATQEPSLDTATDTPEPENYEAAEKPAAASAAVESPGKSGQEGPASGAVDLQDMFRGAQEAILRGDTAGAKLIALRTAAQIARAEADLARDQVRETEERLKEGDSAIQGARERVREAEQGVKEAEELVGRCTETLGERQTVAGTKQEELSEAESTLADFEERIRKLQAERDEHAAQTARIREELQDARTDEKLSREELEEKARAEEAARVALEDARQKVKDMHYRRVEIEARLEQARDMFTRRRMSLGDIEQTLNQVTQGSAEPNDEADLLF